MTTFLPRRIPWIKPDTQRDMLKVWAEIKAWAPHVGAFVLLVGFGVCAATFCGYAARILVLADLAKGGVGQ